MAVGVGTGGTEHVGVWIDYNQNGTFENNEFVNLGSGSGVTVTGQISIPSFAIVGTTKMRVRTKYSTAFAETEACSSVSYGTTRDYTVEILPAPSCLPPATLTVSNLTPTSAVLSWTSAGSLFDIEWGQGSFPQGQGAIISGVSNSYNLGGLTANTSYSYYVRQDCGSSQSTWSGPYSFFTGYCIPTGTSSSYRINGFSTEGGYTNISNMANGTTSAYNDYTAMSVSQSPGGEITYSVNVNSGVGVKIWIDLNNDLVFDASELVASHLVYIGTTPNIWTGTLTVPTGLSLGDYRVRVRTNYYSYIFEACGEGQYGYGETEDYTLSVVAPPSCMPPSALSSSGYTFTSANLAWSSAGSLFDVEWGVGTFPQGQGTVISGVTNPYTLNGLTESTSYSYYVRQDCGSETSLWSGPHSFTTPTPGQIGDGTATSTSLPIATCMGYNYSQQIYLASELQAVLEPGNTYITKIRFKQTTLGGGANYKDWVVYMKNTSKSIFSTTTDWESGLSEVFSGEIAYSNLGWVEITLNTPFNWDGTSNIVVGVDENTPSWSCTAAWATFASGSDRAMAYNNDSVNPNPLSPPTANVSPTANIPQIQIVSTPVPSCLAPADLLASNITSSSAELSWSSTGSMFDIKFGIGTFDPDTGGIAVNSISNPYILNGLEANTLYSFYVRRDCAGEASDWSGPYSFTTECEALGVLPYSENFESATVPNLPSCTSIQTLNGTAWKTSTSTANGFTGKKLNYSYHPAGTGTADSWFFTQGLVLEAGKNYAISYKYGNNSTYYTESMRVAYGTSADAIAMSNPIADHASINTTLAIENEVYFMVPANGVYYFGFQSYSDANQNQLYLDDILIRELGDPCTGTPDAGIATASMSSGESGSAVDFAVTGYDNTTEGLSYDWEYSTDSGASWDSTGVSDDEVTFTITGTVGTVFQVRYAVTCSFSENIGYSNVLTFTVTQPLDYCVPIYTYTGDRLSAVTTTGAVSDITYTNSTGGQHYDQTNMILETTPGQQFTINTAYQSGGQTIGIWIDWDNNNTFDDLGDRVVISNGTSPQSFTVTIPSDVNLGDYRLRVRGSWGDHTADGDAFACNSKSYGSSVDFTIRIAAPCSSEWTGAVSTDWNTAGNWCDNTVPTAGSNVVIDTPNPAVINNDVGIASITLGADANLTVNGSLEVGDMTVAAGGSLVVANDANLFQPETAVNSGAIKVQRNATIKHLDYTIWSSPVMGQGLQSFSPNTLASRIYDYNTTTDTWEITTGNFVAGKGVMFRAPNLFDDGYYPNAYTYVGEFNGAPNNGDVTMNFPNLGTYQGVGNPYPSNMDIEEFWMTNPSTGTLYFWTNTNAWDSGAGDYVANNWATYSTLGGLPAAGGTQAPEDVVLVGQGFVVEATGLNSVVFTNDMRTAQSGVFFRTAVEDKHRLWLNLSDASNEVNNILIGYMDGATQGEDLRIDSKMFNYEGSALYSLIDGSQSAYVIQGRSLPFDDFDVVPLGFRAMTSGSFTVSLTDFDGVFAQGQDIFLKDNLTQTQHNLKDGDYTFVSTQGEFATRFEVVYRASMDVTTPELDTTWVVYAKDKTFFIETQGIDMQQVVVYDMLGRVIYESQAEGNMHSFAQIGASQVLVIKVITTDGQELTKKVAH